MAPSKFQLALASSKKKKFGTEDATTDKSEPTTKRRRAPVQPSKFAEQKKTSDGGKKSLKKSKFLTPEGTKSLPDDKSIKVVGAIGKSPTSSVKIKGKGMEAAKQAISADSSEAKVHQSKFL